MLQTIYTMRSWYFLFILFQMACITSNAQNNHQSQKPAQAWADSVFKTFTQDEQIAQLMILRLSAYDTKAKKPIYYDKEVAEAIKKYNVGGICPFQGDPVKLATIINTLQSLAKTPLITCIDAEWGVGMRLFDSVAALPHQMMLGAMQDASIVYKYGKIVGEQCKRLGINVNYAPVVDINNNPNNPVINDRSFGEDKYRVALYGIQYMQGMQDVGVMACAKHFPGHGDVSVDSHYDLPVINKSLTQLDSLELYPFREIFNAGIGSVMMAHLFIPAIDSTQNRATSISPNAVKKLMRSDLSYNGLTFTDALEMQGVKKYFPNGEASAQSLIAGNDMLCLPGDVELSIKKIKEAIQNKKLSWQDIELHCKRVLMAKYQYGVSQFTPINTTNITAELNKDILAMKKLVAENAITILQKENKELFNLTNDLKNTSSDIAYVGIGLSTENVFAKGMRADYNAGVFLFNYKQDAGRVLSIIELIKTKFKKVVIGIHGYNRTPANNFGISKIAIDLVKQLQQQTNSITLAFGNPYAIKNFCAAKNLVACYEDDAFTQQAAMDLLQGKITAKGKLPVTVCAEYKFGSGIVASDLLLPKVKAEEVGLSTEKLAAIDAVATNAIAQGATPGCVVLVVKDGKIAYEKAFGHYNYDNKELVTTESVYDMASVTKICATTLAVMKLYEEGKIDLKKTLGDYLPWTKGSNKAPLVLEEILLHQAGLVPYIPFNKETIDAAGTPLSTYYNTQKNDSFSIKVAENLFMRNSWKDTMYQRILQSPLTAKGKYVYSDNDFIFLAKVVEAISGVPLDEYVKEQFYAPLQLTSAGFKPREHLPLNRIAPSENEAIFRKQLLRGNVHDPGAAMFGGVAGHAGLFSDAYDIAIIMQMLLNGGSFNGKQYLKKETINYFTAYHSNISRRGFGFDKPEKDNATRTEPYPSISVSPLTFGHTGFTGTCVWADPAHNLTYVFLSNRVTPDGGANTKLYKLNVRTTIQEIIYGAMMK